MFLKSGAVKQDFFATLINITWLSENLVVANGRTDTSLFHFCVGRNSL